MSTRDMNPEDDAKFEAFLRKEDELAKLLQELPQPQPSAELDAAILADAEAALAQEGAARGAANDAAFPGGVQRPSFLTRWKLPFAMVATTLLTLSLVWRQHGGLEGDGPIQVAQAPVSEAAPVAAAPAAETAAAPPIPEAKDELKLAEAGAARKALAKPKAPARQANAKPREDAQPTQLAQADQLPPPAPRQESPRAYAAPEPTVIAKAEIAEAPAPEASGYARNLSRSIMAAPAAPPPAAPAAQAKAVQEKAARDEAQAEARAAVARKEAAPTAPQAWLKRIDEKIEAGSPQEALEEWTRFRKVFPAYEVPKPLLEKIEKIERLKK